MFFLVYLVTVITSVSAREISTFKNESDNAEGRIAGGMRAPDNSNVYGFVYQVQINMFRQRAFCSGAILNSNYIVTACHCVHNARPEDLEVRAGSTRRGTGILLPIASIHCHPEYNKAWEYDYDVAYLRLKGKVARGRKVRPVYLNKFEKDPEYIAIAGWGVAGPNGDKLRDDLWYADMKLISNFICQAYYPDTFITERMFCAQSDDLSQGPCKGDAGGAAVLSAPDLAGGYRTLRLYGISSFSRPCGPGMGPSVFTYINDRKIYEFLMNGTEYLDHVYAEYYWDY